MASQHFKQLNDDPEYINPRKMHSFKEIPEATQAFFRLFGKRKFVIILTKCDKYRYVEYRTKLCEYQEQMWIAGDGLVIDQNPDRAILIKDFCTRTKTWCCGYGGADNNTFFSVCPHCKHVFVAVADSKVECDWCRRELDINNKDFTWIKYGCVNCPAAIGLDKANLELDFAYKNQAPRAAITRDIDAMDEKEKENGNNNQQ